jgi:spoIIIJ-associated protein
MEMKRIEAETLEAAYSKAAKELNCSVTEINYEIIQHPTSGMMGLFKKTAIIIAVKKISTPEAESLVTPKVVESTTEEVEELHAKITENEQAIEAPKSKTFLTSEKIENIETVVQEKDKIVDNFFNGDGSSKVEESKEVVSFDDDRETPENKKLSLEIENKIMKLMSVACFHIDTVEVDVFNGIAHIFIDGEDAALLIGKEGYRYNALSYMLFNWINAEYNLYIKLEISEFIQAQEEMIDNYLKPIAEHIIEHGRGQTKPLDGILVQIALEKLRAMFPNKYIAIKTGRDGKKFIIINDFNSRKK